MHGVVNRGLQSFISDMYGPDHWTEICARAELPYSRFETMLVYDDATTETLLETSCNLLNRSRAELLEDFGTYVVSSEKLFSVRRLMRLGGETYEEFLQSLEEVHDRAKIAMPDLDVPKFTLKYHREGQFTLHLEFDKLGYGGAVLGLLRGMADDYDALVMIDHFPQMRDDLDVDYYNIHVLRLGWNAALARMSSVAI